MPLIHANMAYVGTYGWTQTKLLVLFHKLSSSLITNMLFSSFNSLWVISWKIRKKNYLKKTFNRGVPFLKNVQINRNLVKIPFLRCINRTSPSVCKIRNLMKKQQAFSAHHNRQALPCGMCRAVSDQIKSRVQTTSLYPQFSLSSLGLVLIRIWGFPITTLLVLQHYCFIVFLYF